MDEDKVLRKASATQRELAHTLASLHKTLENASAHLHDYYKTVPAEELSERISITYQSFDTNRDGVMQASELSEALVEMGMHLSEEELQQLFEEYDADGNGTIELDEYEHIVRTSLGVTKECRCRQCMANRPATGATGKASRTSEAASRTSYDEAEV